jgi:chemotaxis protein MotA
LLQSPLSAFKRAMQILAGSVSAAVDLAGGIDRVVNWSLTARKEGLLGLEGVADAEPDNYSRKGLQLLVDGAEPEAIRSILEVDFYTQESRDIEAAKVFESMGGYAPTIGIIGAVMGLIHVMGNLADPSQLGSGIAVAFVATIYGVASANLVLLPIASKLKSIALRQSRYREMLLEGILSIAEGENPRSIELKLRASWKLHASQPDAGADVTSPSHEEHVNHERWLVSYADFITLLFAFFVVMYSISSINEGKYKVISQALIGVFNDADRSLKPIPIGEERPKTVTPAKPLVKDSERPMPAWAAPAIR